jgi:hypothetical protein
VPQAQPRERLRAKSGILPRFVAIRGRIGHRNPSWAEGSALLLVQPGVQTTPGRARLKR